MFYFSETMFSLIEYTVGREVMRADGHRIKSDSYKGKTRAVHYGKWISVKTNCKNRLVDSQLIMQYFVFGDREMKFESFDTKLKDALADIGKFEMIRKFFVYADRLIFKLEKSKCLKNIQIQLN